MAVCVATWAFVAGGGAAGIQAQELIHACVKPSQGQLRIVAAAEACPAGERRLEWPAGAPSTGALRVVDAGGKFIGRYGDGGTTGTITGQQRVCYTFDQPPLFQKYAPAQTFDLGVFTTPYRVVQ